MSYLLYTAIIIGIIFFVYGALTRKKIYKEVDKLEDWKNDILNRPIPDEIGKVKGLNMSGETEEKFETWRTEWDDIVGTILPNIEEQLFDIEELANKYRFQKAKQVLVTVEQRLNTIEEQLSLMVKEVEHFVQSEENNRSGIREAQAEFQELRKHVLTKRGSLAGTAIAFDEKLDRVASHLASFDELTQSGNYLQASDILNEAIEQLSEVRDLLDRVPKLFIELQTNLPADFSELQAGMKEMEDAGFYLTSFAFDVKLEALEEQRQGLVNRLLVLDCEGLEETIKEITENVEQMYGTLENEVKAKQTLIEAIPTLEQNLEQTKERLKDLKMETESVQLSYRLAEEELASQQKIGKQLNELSKQLQVIHDSVEHQKQTYSSLHMMLNEWEEGLQKIQEQIIKAQESLTSLRHDELKAKEALKDLKQTLLNGKRELQKSNIPGVPQKLLFKLEEGEEKLLAAANKLEEIPLEMGQVTALVNEAHKAVEENQALIESTIEKAKLSEQLIQYGNRYRSKSEKVHQLLAAAEQMFRSYEYDEAIELAIQAIEPYETDVVEKLQSHAG
ncbi:septation ring formation regulator EzrA [Halalkalibacterium ligniniphilum]|uniref:septation ring formation regulator EzrA n=1 Tax=Halalkalibacterium ligniniphilum TaxID=1134413 RepID=UPI00034B67EC|nr:septation ring formation regulator EzrA [Halalkalibacterium ligniniphilum]